LAFSQTFEKEELNIKILKSLNKTWYPKVTAISKSRDLTSLNMTTLFGKLREYELDLGRLEEEEERERRHTVALKTIAKAATKSIARKTKSTDDLDDENLTVKH